MRRSASRVQDRNNPKADGEKEVIDGIQEAYRSKSGDVQLLEQTYIKLKEADAPHRRSLSNGERHTSSHIECPHCGARSSTTAKFCAQCGAPLNRGAAKETCCAGACT